MGFWGDEFKGERSHQGDRPRALKSDNVRHYVLPGLVTLVMALVVVFMLLPFFMDRDEADMLRAAQPASGSVQDKLLDDSQRRIQIANEVKPTVVSVINYPEKLSAKEKAKTTRYGLGSGVIFNISGNKALVVTNQHVIADGAELEVVLTSGETRKARLVGEDLFSDLAVLEIDKKGVERVARFGDSDLLEEGQSVMAIGNPLGISFSQTITAGIISSLRTPVPVFFGYDGQVDWEVELIQTDAAINRGNSGGALVNLDGEVIGINSMKVSDFGVEGLGFAIPSNDAVEIIRSLVEHGRVKRPFIGIASRDLSLYAADREELVLPDDVEEGAFVLTVEGPASKAGLKTGDVIVQFDDTPIDSTLALRKYLYEHKAAGDQVKVTFYRGKEKLEVTVELVERKEE